jgi:hypothetical protein
MTLQGSVGGQPWSISVSGSKPTSELPFFNTATTSNLAEFFSSQSRDIGEYVNKKSFGSDEKWLVPMAAAKCQSQIHE